MLFNILNSVIKNRLGLIQHPSFITFFITWRCNSRCVMCDVWKKRQDAESELSVQEIESIFRQLKSIDAIRISGGEPFLRNDISDIINVIDKIVCPKIIHITTNGLLTNQIVDAVQKIKSIQKIHLKISIDSVGEAHDRIRGVTGAYGIAMKTAEELSKLRRTLPFYLGVNQTIVDKNGMKSYYKLCRELEKFNVIVHPVFAYKNSTSLYSADNIKTSPKFETYGDFSKEELADFIKKLIKDAGLFSDFKESLVKKYYLKGVYERVVNNIEKPKPTCLALKSHLRILPNGNVPICLYNSTVAGNLRREKFKDLWFGEKMKEYRNWVKKCPGCWAGCESIVSAVYSGDIIKGLF